MSASQRIPLSVLARNSHKGLSREISSETGRRRGKARSQGSQQKRGVSDSQKKETVREKQLLKEKLGPVDLETGSASARGWVTVLGSCVGILSEIMLAIATECRKGAKNYSLLTLRANPSPFLFVLLSSTLGYIYYICYIFVRYVKCYWLEMRETTRLSNGHELK